MRMPKKVIHFAAVIHPLVVDWLSAEKNLRGGGGGELAFVFKTIFYFFYCFFLVFFF